MRLFEITLASNTSAIAALINRNMAHHPQEKSTIRVNRASLEGDFDEFLIFGRSAESATKSLTAIAQIHNGKATPINDMPSSFDVEQAILEDNPISRTYVTLDRLS